MIISSPYMGPGGNEEYRIHIALIFLLVPFYFTSYYFENEFFQNSFSPDKEDQVIATVIKKLNIISYLFLFLVVVVCFSYYAITSKLIIRY
jgi:hypothetical protein